MIVSRYTLKELEVEGFRGVNSPLRLDFDAAATLLLGDNGTGKSSLLGAIEWCLFGDVAFLAFLESKGKKDELVNVFTSDRACKVRVVLENEDGPFVVERGKELGTAKAKLVLSLDGQEFHGDEAKAMLTDHLGLTFEDFYRAVYLPQQPIRGLLTDKPADRDEAMDRLFGLETLRNIAGALSVRSVESKIRDLSAQKESLEHEVYGARRQIEADYREGLQRAQKMGLDASAISPDYVSSIMKEVLGGLEGLADEYDLPPHGLTVPETVQEKERILERLRDYLQSARRTKLPTGDLDSIVSALTALKTLREEIPDAQQEIRVSEGAISRQLSGIGDEESIEGELKKIEERLAQNEQKIEETLAAEDELEQDRSALSAHVRVAEDGLEYLRTVETDRCPVCDQVIERQNVIVHLEEVLDRLEKDALRGIDAQVKVLRKDRNRAQSENEAQRRRKEELRSATEDLEHRRAALSKAQERYERLLQDAENLAGQRIPSEEVLDVLSSLISEYERKQDRLAKLQDSREELIQLIDESIRRARAALEVVQKKGKFERVEVMYQAEREETDRLEGRIAALNGLAESLTLIEEAIVEVQQSLADEAVRLSAQDIDDFYRTLCNHPYYLQLRIEARPRKAAGRIRNSYQIRALNPSDGLSTLAATRLSTGQMNCVALAVYLALAKVQSHSLNFLLLDDPSQSLDSSHKAALADLLNTVCQDRRVVVATQDEELAGFLLKRVRPAGKRLIYRLSSWSQAGPDLSQV